MMLFLQTWWMNEFIKLVMGLQEGEREKHIKFFLHDKLDKK